MQNNINEQGDFNPLHSLRALSDDERIDAYESARAVIMRKLGDRPARDSFAQALSRYPVTVTRIIGVTMALVFIGAALPSLFRLFTAGRDYFLHGIDDPVQAAIVGVSTFLLAEFLIILSTIAARVFFTGRARLVFVVPVALGLAVALVGNWVVAQPVDVFGWLETIAPPLAVLFMALVGERLILESIETRHSNEIAFQAALADWQAKADDHERHEYWRTAYANALKQRLSEANARGTGATARKEVIAAMKPQDWRPLVQREIDAERWYEQDEQPAPTPFVSQIPDYRISPPSALVISTNGNGKHDASGG